jgi:GGDEF domain-containing protein
MKSSKLSLGIIIIIFVQLFFIAWFFISIFITIDKTTDKAHEHFSILSNRVYALFRSDELSNAQRASYIRQTALSSPYLRLLLVSKDNNNLEYLYALDSDHISGRTDLDDLTINQITAPEKSFRSLTFNEEAPKNAGNSLYITAHYDTINRQDLFMIFRPLFFGVLLFAFFLLIFMVNTRTGATREKASSSREETSPPHSDLKGDEPLLTEEDELSVAPKALEPEPVTLFSPRSGLCWEDFLNERLTNELKRSASFEQELTLALVSCENLQHDSYRKAAERFSTVFPMRDMTFEYGSKGFAVIMPNTTLFSAIEQMKEFIHDTEVALTECGTTMRAGMSSRSGRLISGELLLKEASISLKKAGEEGFSNIMAFRPDPGKFRDYLAKKSGHQSS